MNIGIWKSVSGGELLEAFTDGTLKEEIPKKSALYLWRRRIFCDTSNISSKSDFQSWMRNLALTPVGVVGPHQITHCVALDGITIGGGGLTSEKERILAELSEKRAARVYLARIIESLGQFTAPIYVGNANDLYLRIKQHLNGETTLEEYLGDELKLRWQDIELQFCELSEYPTKSEKEKEVQELLEFLGQRLLAPIGTKRPG